MPLVTTGDYWMPAPDSASGFPRAADVTWLLLATPSHVSVTGNYTRRHPRRARASPFPQAQHGRTFCPQDAPFARMQGALLDKKVIKP